jgi:small subunit ribosomal protein S16
MAVRIRLARAGAKKHPFYHVVAAHSTNARDGRFLEAIGTYDPTKKPAAVSLDDARLKHWLDAGAKPTETVAQIIRRYKKAQPAKA